MGAMVEPARAGADDLCIVGGADSLTASVKSVCVAWAGVTTARSAMAGVEGLAGVVVGQVVVPQRSGGEAADGRGVVDRATAKVPAYSSELGK